jgi:hypothetical protein
MKLRDNARDQRPDGRGDVQGIIVDVEREYPKGQSLIVGQAGHIIEGRGNHQGHEISKTQLLQSGHNCPR